MIEIAVVGGAMGDSGQANQQPHFRIDTLRETDREQWETLYRGYMEFYGRDEPASLYDEAWERLCLDRDVHGRVARDVTDETHLFGLVHFVRHPTMATRDVCYMQDLFTDPEARGGGVGTQLIQAVVGWCKETGGISKVYWNTHETNPARKKLYDVVGTHRGFVKYEISIQAKSEP